MSMGRGGRQLAVRVPPRCAIGRVGSGWFTREAPRGTNTTGQSGSDGNRAPWAECFVGRSSHAPVPETMLWVDPNRPPSRSPEPSGIVARYHSVHRGVGRVSTSHPMGIHGALEPSEVPG
jgi:hypothetical protein